MITRVYKSKDPRCSPLVRRIATALCMALAFITVTEKSCWAEIGKMGEISTATVDSSSTYSEYGSSAHVINELNDAIDNLYREGVSEETARVANINRSGMKVLHIESDGQPDWKIDRPGLWGINTPFIQFDPTSLKVTPHPFRANDPDFTGTRDDLKARSLTLDYSKESTITAWKNINKEAQRKPIDVINQTLKNESGEIQKFWNQDDYNYLYMNSRGVPPIETYTNRNDKRIQESEKAEADFETRYKEEYLDLQQSNTCGFIKPLIADGIYQEATLDPEYRFVESFLAFPQDLKPGDPSIQASESDLRDPEEVVKDGKLYTPNELRWTFWPYTPQQLAIREGALKGGIIRAMLYRGFCSADILSMTLWAHLNTLMRSPTVDENGITSIRLPGPAAGISLVKDGCQENDSKMASETAAAYDVVVKETREAINSKNLETIGAQYRELLGGDKVNHDSVLNVSKAIRSTIEDVINSPDLRSAGDAKKSFSQHLLEELKPAGLSTVTGAKLVAASNDLADNLDKLANGGYDKFVRTPLVNREAFYRLTGFGTSLQGSRTFISIVGASLDLWSLQYNPKATPADKVASALSWLPLIGGFSSLISGIHLGDSVKIYNGAVGIVAGFLTFAAPFAVPLVGFLAGIGGLLLLAGVSVSGYRGDQDGFFIGWDNRPQRTQWEVFKRAQATRFQSAEETAEALRHGLDVTLLYRLRELEPCGVPFWGFKSFANITPLATFSNASLPGHS